MCSALGKLGRDGTTLGFIRRSTCCKINLYGEMFSTGSAMQLLRSTWKLISAVIFARLMMSVHTSLARRPERVLMRQADRAYRRP